MFLPRWARRRLLLLPALLLGCGLLDFVVENDTTTTIPGAGVLGELLGALDFTGLNDLDVEIQQELADQGVEEGDLRSVTLTVLNLHAEPDLAFLESMDVYVSSAGANEVLVASGGSFPVGQTSVELETTGVDLVEIVTAGGMNFRVEAEGSAPEDDTDVDIHVEIEVAATAQGACHAANR